MEKRNGEKDIRLIRRWEKKAPTSLTSRYAHHYLKGRYGIEGIDDRSSNFDSKVR